MYDRYIRVEKVDTTREIDDNNENIIVRRDGVSLSMGAIEITGPGPP